MQKLVLQGSQRSYQVSVLGKLLSKERITDTVRESLRRAGKTGNPN